MYVETEVSTHAPDGARNFSFALHLICMGVKV